MSFALDILEVVLALTAMVGCVAILFSPFIAYTWCRRREQRPRANRRRGFPVILITRQPK